MINKLKPTYVKGIGAIETPDDNPYLLHFICPLERAAFRNNFRSFTYNFDGVELLLMPAMCRDLFMLSKKHTSGLRRIAQQARQNLLAQDPVIKKFLSKPLRNQKLPIRLYHTLYGNGCYTMGMVADKGEHELKRMRGMGKRKITYLVNLFTDNGCGSLFQ